MPAPADVQVKLLVETTEISGPAFFPDNQRIAYAEGPAGSRKIALNGDLLTQEGDCFEPAVAPDGSTVAFTWTDPDLGGNR